MERKELELYIFSKFPEYPNLFSIEDYLNIEKIIFLQIFAR